MEIIQVKDAIEKIIKQIGEVRRQLEEKGNAKAAAIADYDMQVALTLVKLRDSEPMEWRGRTVKNIPTTLAEKIAKGMCRDERLYMEECIAGYNALTSNLQALMAQLNAYQSIFRHLDET